jgi:hypothetical protein
MLKLVAIVMIHTHTHTQKNKTMARALPLIRMLGREFVALFDLGLLVALTFGRCVTFSFLPAQI